MAMTVIRAFVPSTIQISHPYTCGLCRLWREKLILVLKFLYEI